MWRWRGPRGGTGGTGGGRRRDLGVASAATAEVEGQIGSVWVVDKVTDVGNASEGGGRCAFCASVCARTHISECALFGGGSKRGGGAGGGGLFKAGTVNDLGGGRIMVLAPAGKPPFIPFRYLGFSLQ